MAVKHGGREHTRYGQPLVIQSVQLPNMGYANEQDDGDCSSVFRQSHSDVLVENGPAICTGKDNCNKECTNAPYYRV